MAIVYLHYQNQTLSSYHHLFYALLRIVVIRLASPLTDAGYTTDFAIIQLIVIAKVEYQSLFCR